MAGTSSRRQSSSSEVKHPISPPPPEPYSPNPNVGPLYAYDSSLPSLPVPTLQSTASKYLASLRPFFPPSSTPSNPSPEEQTSTSAVNSFLSSPLVQKLQERLIQRSEKPESDGNWLADWWNETAYFGVRDGNVPGVNYYYVHRDDKARMSGEVREEGWKGHKGAQRAAGLIRGALVFREMVENQTLLPETVRSIPLDSSTYRYLFNSARIPKKGCDTAQKFDARENGHIVVIRKGRFFDVKVTDEKGRPLSERELRDQLQKVVDLAGSERTSHPIGAFTTGNRDSWAEARENLELDPVNASSLRRIDSAAIVLAMEDSKPVTREQVSWGVWVGSNNGRDRWFDKHQLVVFDNGKSGFNGEHSCMDGTPTSRLNDWMLRSLYSKKLPLGDTHRPISTTPYSPETSLPPPTELSFNLTSEVQSRLKDAESAFDQEMGKMELSVLHYEGYGKETIKSFKTSPDSWVQMVMQLAYWKLSKDHNLDGSAEGKLAGTYESCQTRKFKRGRTEVIRSASEEARQFVRAMEDPKADDSTKANLFRKAVKTHLTWAGWAADGQAVDRHLFGLKKLLQQGEELPDIYKDPLFPKSSHWTLSTSQLSSEFFEGWGYGPVVPDGFGLAYAVNNHNLRFTIATTNPGEAQSMRHYLAEAATELRQTMEGDQKQKEKESGVVEGDSEKKRAKL